MEARLAKVGNSVSVRLPRAILADLKLSAGDSVEVAIRNKAIVLKPVRGRAKRKRITLRELLKGLSAERLAPELGWGKAVGEEL